MCLCMNFACGNCKIVGLSFRISAFFFIFFFSIRLFEPFEPFPVCFSLWPSLLSKPFIWDRFLTDRNSTFELECFHFICERGCFFFLFCLSSNSNCNEIYLFEKWDKFTFYANREANGMNEREKSHNSWHENKFYFDDWQFSNVENSNWFDVFPIFGFFSCSLFRLLPPLFASSSVRKSLSTKFQLLRFAIMFPFSQVCMCACVRAPDWEDDPFYSLENCVQLIKKHWAIWIGVERSSNKQSATTKSTIKLNSLDAVLRFNNFHCAFFGLRKNLVIESVIRWISDIGFSVCTI